MATITEVTMGRVDHYRFEPLDRDTSILEAARCECGACWRHSTEPLSTFCTWAMDHQAPLHIAAAISWAQRRPVCPGSNEFIRATRTTDGAGPCPRCRYITPTTPAQGYGGWATIDAHPAPIGAIQ